MEIVFIFVLLIGVGVSHLIGKAAEDKGHSYWGFFILTLFFFPLGLLAVLLIRPIQEKVVPDSSLVKCEFCAELIKREAKICKHCGKDVPEDKLISNQADIANLPTVFTSITKTEKEVRDGTVRCVSCNASNKVTYSKCFRCDTPIITID